MALQDDAIAPAQADQLQSADPADWPVAPDWQPLVEDFFAGATGQQLLTFLHQRLEAGAVIFPPQPLRALELTPPEEVRVVILGQDPYHGPGQAHGLCFSVLRGVRPPPSLANMYKELREDVGFAIPDHGNLEGWAKQGVLLLNSSLTVRAGQAGSHQGKGWERFTDAAVKALSDGREGLVFLLWGRPAQLKGSIIDPARHHVLKAAHPSPLSAHGGFFGCKHFSKTNALLRKVGKDPIDWQI